jgi:hypothetical protein
MKKENQNKTEECCRPEDFFKHHHGHCHGHKNSCSNAIYGLGVVGALFYFLQNATGFGMVMIGIGKSFFWPAILMFKLLTYLQM